MVAVKLGLVGIGKIARDQHLPAIASDARFDLAATASRHGQVDGVPAYNDIAAMTADISLDAVSLCTPPDGRFEQAYAAIEARLHVMLEKPPAATLTHIDMLIRAANNAGVTLFAAWHSREAAGVAPAKIWLADKRIDAVRIEWREDIRLWHPGQEWILEAGGFGVFDPGINALSIATEILPDDLVLERGLMSIPVGRSSPLAASLSMRCGAVPVRAEFDFLQAGEQIWSIEVDTNAGMLALNDGGAVLRLPDGTEHRGANNEYARLYDHFADLIAARQSDVDIRPMRLVADAFLSCRRMSTPPFSF